MISRAAKRIVRTVQLGPVLGFLFAGCTCSSSPPDNPTPPVVPGRPEVPLAANVPSVTPVTPTVVLSPTPNAEATATVVAAYSLCDGFVEALSGRKQDEALLGKPEVQALAQRAPDLVMCGAVQLDSEALCRLLRQDPGQQGAKECLLTRAIFQELRAYPNGRTFYMTDIEWRDCHSGVFAPACDALREAMRSGDATKCVLKADYEAICRRVFTDLDKSQCRKMAPEIKRVMEARCRAHATIDKSACHLEAETGDLFERRAKFLTEAEGECTLRVEERACWGKGLDAVVESGSARERELAKAALRRADACEPYTRSAKDDCLASFGIPAAVGAPPLVKESPQPTAPAPGRN